MKNFTIAADACVRQMKYGDLSLLQTGRRGNTTLELIDIPDSDYRTNYIVSVDSRRLGMLRMNHVKAVVDRELLSFRYDNTMLYRLDAEDMKTFINDYDLTPANITCLEIAIDTNIDLITEFSKYFNNPTDYNYHYSPTSFSDLQKVRVVGDVWRDGSTNFTLYPHIANDKTLKIYDKTADIKYKNKSYISDYHALNGLDTSQTVYRVELTLLNTAFKSKQTIYTNGVSTLTAYEYKNLTDSDKDSYNEQVIMSDTTPTIEDLCNPEKLLSLFCEYTNNFKAFSIKDNTRTNRCTPVELLDLSCAKPLTGINYIHDEKHYKNHMTTTFKTLIRNFYTTGKGEYMKIAEMLAKDNNTVPELEKQIRSLSHLRTLYQKQQPVPGYSLF